MAKIVEEIVIVKVSKLVRSGNESAILDTSFTPTLEALVTEVIADPSVIVEVTSAEDPAAE